MRIKDLIKTINFMLIIQEKGGLEKWIGKPVNPGKLINIWDYKEG